MKNYYAILGILPTASQADIRSTYRLLAKRYHPDKSGGRAFLFSRVSEAHEVLSDPNRRKAYDRQRRPVAPGKSPPRPAAKSAARQQPAPPRQKPAPARQQPAPPRSARPRPGKPAARNGNSRVPLEILTRVMSIAVPRTGRFQLQGLIGNIQIEPTLPEKLWDTTLKKFGPADPGHLARHVIQIRLSGERDLVKTMMPRPTDFGVEFQQSHDEEKKNRLKKFLDGLLGKGVQQGVINGNTHGLFGALIPVSVQITVPKGTPLFLKEITGTVAIGDVEGDVSVRMLGGVLKAGRVGKTILTLNGGSRAFISGAGGNVDLMGFGTSKTYLAGNISRLRTVLENGAQAEINAPIVNLEAEVRGNGGLRINKPVRIAFCRAQDRGRIWLQAVTGSMEMSRTLWARIETMSYQSGVADSV